jgi:NitT/TauT family transport system permease protein
MTNDRGLDGLMSRVVRRAAPVFTVVAIVIAIWYVAALAMNIGKVRDTFEREETPYTTSELIAASLNDERPVLPAPHQIAISFCESVFGYAPSSPRSLVYHSAVTLSAAALGFVIGSLFGILLAILIIHLRVMEKSLLPWIICSQMVPILAVAPIVIVVLGSIGIHGLLPKSIISAYLCFFPVTIGMVKGLSSADRISHDLMRTWSASPAQTFRKLRWPTATPYLFASLKVAVTVALVGAIVGELPTGVQAGLGARLLAGSYYGQTIQMWAALLAASILAASLVGLTDLVQRAVGKAMGARA